MWRINGHWRLPPRSGEIRARRGSDEIVDCHCSRCRKVRGTNHATNLLIQPAQLRWVRGEELITHYRHPEAECFGNSFCRVCGSPLPEMDMPAEGCGVAPAGSLEGDPGGRERLHIFVGSKALWDEIADDLPQFDTLPPGFPATRV